MYEMVHVVYAPSFMVGGINTYVNEIFKYFNKKNNSVGIVYIDKIINNVHDFNELDQFKINSIYKIYKKIYDKLPLKTKEYVKLKNIEKKLIQIKNKVNKDTIFHIHSVLLYDIVKKHFRDNKTVLTLHGYYTYEHLSDGDVSENSKKYYKMLNIEKKVYNKADKIIAVDKKLFNHCKTLLPNANVCMKPNFVDNIKFKPISNNKKMELKKKLGLDNKIVYITTRRLEIKNGVHVFAKAIDELSEDVKRNSFFLIVGDGSEREKIEKILKNSKKNILMPGSIPHDKIIEYYQLSDIFVIPSISIDNVEEATSISTLEAMSCGNIVIASNIGGLKILIEDNKNGFLVDENNPLQLKEKIEYVYNNFDKLDEIRNNAINTIKEKYSIENYYHFLIDVYASVKGEKSVKL